MRDAADFAEVNPAGPLFEWAEGPFTRSKVQPTPQEALVGGLIWKHTGRRNPISIAEITRQTGFHARQVKEVVEQLRVTHRAAIGARREEPAGYFRIVDAEDLEETVGPYRSQILRMFQVYRALDEAHRVREFLGQLSLQEGE